MPSALVKTETKTAASTQAQQMPRLRLDKWLWAARFYKTRAMARRAIEGGKVSCDGHRCKPSKEITPGNEIRLRQGYDEKTVMVKALREQRRSAPEAQTLYAETPQSIARRQLLAEQRKMQPRPPQPDTKPTKKQRRQIQRFHTGHFRDDSLHAETDYLSDQGEGQQPEASSDSQNPQDTLRSHGSIGE